MLTVTTYSIIMNNQFVKIIIMADKNI